MRKMIIAVAALLAIPMVGAAAVMYAPAQEEQLVEGHTVFTVIQVRNSTTIAAREEFAAAVAVLIRERVDQIEYKDRFPGVLWFNDQYLVNPSGSAPTVTAAQQTRYPCGAVIAVNAGDPLPTSGGVPVVPSNATFLEAYRIKDPNELDWDVDKWIYDPDNSTSTANSFLIWSVAVNNNQARYGVPDDGVTTCTAQTDGGALGCHFVTPFSDGASEIGRGGPNDPYRDDGAAEGRTCVGQAPSTRSGAPAVQYNAVLYFFLQDLTATAGTKTHKETVAAGDDTYGCHPNSSWPCPGGDDNREGNSHPYGPRPTANNGNLSYPRILAEGKNNHGGSVRCGAGDIGGGPQYQHATCNIDVYFGYVASTDLPTLPAKRAANYRVYDTEGRTAPYHCHSDFRFCNEEDVAPDHV